MNEYKGVQMNARISQYARTKSASALLISSHLSPHVRSRVISTGNELKPEEIWIATIGQGLWLSRNYGS